MAKKKRPKIIQEAIDRVYPLKETIDATVKPDETYILIVFGPKEGDPCFGFDNVGPQTDSIVRNWIEGFKENMERD